MYPRQVLLGKDVPSWLKLGRAIEGATIEMGFGRQPRVFTGLVAEFRCFHNQSTSCGEKLRARSAARRISSNMKVFMKSKSSRLSIFPKPIYSSR